MKRQKAGGEKGQLHQLGQGNKGTQCVRAKGKGKGNGMARQAAKARQKEVACCKARNGQGTNESGGKARKAGKAGQRWHGAGMGQGTRQGSVAR